MNPSNIHEVQGKELVYQRMLDAPPELVFEAWSQPEHLARWWGPNGFTLTTLEMNMRTGGHWRFTMHGPDGRDYPNKINFIEVDPPGRIEYQHADDGETDPVSFHVTVTFEAVGDKTGLTMRMTFVSREDLERVEREYGAIAGAHQTLDRLADYTEKSAVLRNP